MAIEKSAQGQGLATEGAKRCLEYAMEECNLKVIQLHAPAINLPSIYVMEKDRIKKGEGIVCFSRIKFKRLWFWSSANP